MRSAAKRVSWADGTRCVVTLTFDNLGDAAQIREHGHSAGAYSEGLYACRVGLDTILGVLRSCGVRGTFFVEGWNADRYPSLVQRIVDGGHEVGAHGWMHESWEELADDAGRGLIGRTTDVLARITGSAPRSWRSPFARLKPSTLRLLCDAGYRVNSDFMDRDVPYYIEIDGAETDLVELPFAWPLDDFVFYSPQAGAVRSARAALEVWVEEFDASYASSGFFMLVCHPWLSGRPSRAAALARLIEHIQASPGVRFCKAGEAADLWRLTEARATAAASPAEAGGSS